MNRLISDQSGKTPDSVLALTWHGITLAGRCSEEQRFFLAARQWPHGPRILPPSDVKQRVINGLLTLRVHWQSCVAHHPPLSVLHLPSGAGSTTTDRPCCKCKMFLDIECCVPVHFLSRYIFAASRPAPDPQFHSTLLSKNHQQKICVGSQSHPLSPSQGLILSQPDGLVLLALEGQKHTPRLFLPAELSRDDKAVQRGTIVRLQ